ncbi:MAG: membrane dipeptidase [Bradyrhizobium sp.]
MNLNVLRDGILCDMLLGPPPIGLMADLESRWKAGFTYTSLSMAGDIGASSDVYSRLAKMRQQLSAHPDEIVLVDRVDDVRAAKKANKLAINFHFQGSEAVGRDLANVGAYYKLGIRQVIYDFYKGDAPTKIAMPAELPWGFFDPAHTPLLLSKLLDKGYSADTVKGIMGGNFLRVAEGVWQ